MGADVVGAALGFRVGNLVGAIVGARVRRAVGELLGEELPEGARALGPSLRLGELLGAELPEGVCVDDLAKSGSVNIMAKILIAMEAFMEKSVLEVSCQPTSNPSFVRPWCF